VEAPEGFELAALVADAPPGTHQAVEGMELLRAIRDAVRTKLTPHQREVFSHSRSTASRSTC
jgi:hypothetical protein